MGDESKEPSSSDTHEPKRWRERYRWLGVLLVAAFAGIGPAPPPPKPPRDLAEYSQIAEDPDGLQLDPDTHFLQTAPDQDGSHTPA